MTQHFARPNGGSALRAADSLTGPAAWVALLVACLVSVGCSRAFWRKQADQDTYAVLSEKLNDARWSLPRIDVTPDPRSRFYDPYDPDKEPLPPDDPAAHQYMHWAAGKRGYKSWHKLGTAFSVENPHWLESLGLTPEMTVKYDPNSGVQLPTIENLTLVQALQLAAIHNREYQDRIERLYLAALDLTFERFRFNLRYLGDPNLDWTFQSIPGVEDSATLRGGFGVRQLLPTGAQLAAELANTTIWMFSGGNSPATATTLSFSLVQPLLRSAGRKIVMENLTQAERDVLYETRSLARFRKELFADIVAGGPSGGFLGLLLQRQNIINQEGNIKRLIEQTEIQKVLASQRPEEISEQLDALPPGFRIPPELSNKLRYDAQMHQLFWRGDMTAEQERRLLQLSDDPAFQKAAKELVQRLRTETITLTVAQLETELAAARSRLRTVQRQFQDALDQFKLQLGLPTDMPVTIDLSMLKPFELIDPALPELEQQIKDYVHDWAQLDEQNPDQQQLRRLTDRLCELRDLTHDRGMKLIEKDFERVEELFQEGLPEIDERGQRRRRFESEEERRRVEKDVQGDRRLYQNLRSDFEEVSSALENLRQQLANPNLPAEVRREAASQLADLREDLLKISQSLQVIQIGLRVELITLEPFSLAEEEAVRLGLENRLDLMNARARVMDARRRVEVAADALEDVLDLRAEGDVRTPAGRNKPFDFRGSTSSFRAGVSLDAPLDLIAERNDYRSALIAYQKARRDYIQFEDSVKLAIRQRWRQLQVSRHNFELSRQRVRIAALQYDSAVEEATAPIQQGGRSGALNLLQALDAVLAAQNNLIADWINYERNRIQIYRDMGLMQIDANGIWEDDYYQRQAYGHESRTREDDAKNSDDDRQPGRAAGGARADHARPQTSAQKSLAVLGDGGTAGGWHPSRAARTQRQADGPERGGRERVRDGGGPTRPHADQSDRAGPGGQPQ